MYQSLLDAIRHTPAVYESSGFAFWDDEHISKAMLENHLSPDSAGATREHKKVKDSVHWLASLPLSGNQLLDLGCGPGIYAELFAERNYRVTGVDISRRSIDHAKESAHVKGLDIEYRCEDYLNLELPANRFDMAILIYCDYGVLSFNDRSRLLTTIFCSLKPGGLFVVDVFSPTQYRSFIERSEVSYEESGFWSNEPYAVITSTKKYPDHHYLERYLVMTEGTFRSYNIWNHAFIASELSDELKLAGFKDVAFFADACGNAYDEGSETLCAVAMKE